MGHRGARATRQIPENTLASFELCLDQGCDGFEFDVRRSSDGKAVICHDAISSGMEIQDTVENDLRLPSLQDVLRQFASRSFFDIELKVAGLEREVLVALRTHPPDKGLVVSSFLPEVLTVIHDLDAGIPLGFLCESKVQLQRFEHPPVVWVIPKLELVDRSLVEWVHAAGKRIMVWTVNGEADMRALAGWGVDAIISDETEILSRVLI